MWYIIFGTSVGLHHSVLILVRSSIIFQFFFNFRTPLAEKCHVKSEERIVTFYSLTRFNIEKRQAKTLELLRIREVIPKIREQTEYSFTRHYGITGIRYRYYITYIILCVRGL